MYTVIATNHFKDVRFEQTYLSFETAKRTFEIATKCRDAKGACLVSALTGEIILDWEYLKGITWTDMTSVE